MRTTLGLVYRDRMRGPAVLALTLLAGGCDLVFAPGKGPGAGEADARDGDGPPPPPPDADLDHNEDRDAFPDIVDMCPHVATPDNLDSDSDGVGDECDSQPNIGNQVRLYFNGFGDTFADLVTFGDLAIAGDELVVTATGGVATAFLFDPHAHVEVFTHVVVDEVAGGAPLADIEAIAGHVGPDDDIDGVSCRIGRDSGQPSTTYYELHHAHIGGPDDTLVGTMTPGEFALLDAPIYFRAAVGANEVYCDFAGTQLFDKTQMPILLGRVGLGVRRASVRFEYLFVVGRTI
jgi:hypothetical protein